MVVQVKARIWVQITTVLERALFCAFDEDVRHRGVGKSIGRSRLAWPYRVRACT